MCTSVGVSGTCGYHGAMKCAKSTTGDKSVIINSGDKNIHYHSKHYAANFISYKIAFYLAVQTANKQNLSHIILVKQYIIHGNAI